MNAVEIEEAISRLAEQPFDATEFPYSFLEAFGNKATTINRLRKRDSNKTDIEGAVLQHNNIHMAVMLLTNAAKFMSRQQILKCKYVFHAVLWHTWKIPPKLSSRWRRAVEKL